MSASSSSPKRTQGRSASSSASEEASTPLTGALSRGEVAPRDVAQARRAGAARSSRRSRSGATRSSTRAPQAAPDSTPATARGRPRSRGEQVDRAREEHPVRGSEPDRQRWEHEQPRKIASAAGVADRGRVGDHGGGRRRVERWIGHAEPAGDRRHLRDVTVAFDGLEPGPVDVGRARSALSTSVAWTYASSSGSSAV